MKITARKVIKDSGEDVLTEKHIKHSVEPRVCYYLRGINIKACNWVHSMHIYDEEKKTYYQIYAYFNKELLHKDEYMKLYSALVDYSKIEPVSIKSLMGIV